MTTPDPAVSVSPVDTDGLREQIAARFAELDARDWGYDHGFVAYGADEESDAFVDAAAELFADREAQLLDQVARLQNRLSIMRGAHQQERDALSLMLRGMARRASWLRADCQDNHDTAETYRYERDTAREQRDQYRHNWDYARQVNEQAAETIAASEKEIARLRAELASRSTPPQDAGLPDTAERLAALARDFRDRAEKTITKALEGEQVADECDSPAECHASTEHFTWKLAALQVEKLVTALSSPATDPVPATPDGPEETKRPHKAIVDNAVAGALIDVYGFVPLDVRYDAAKTARGIVQRWLDSPGPVYDLLDDDANEPMGEDPEAAREVPDDEPVAPQSPAVDTGTCPECRCAAPIHKTWCPEDASPVAPQAPAKPIVDEASLTALRAKLRGEPAVPAVPEGTATRRPLLNTTHRRNPSLDTVALHDCGGDPKCCGNPEDEDTATPDDEYGDDLAAPFLRSSAGECREMVPDGPESYMSCGADTVPGTDRCDDHRADTTRPAGEESQ